MNQLIGKNFFIFCHGFCSKKESNSIEIVAKELLKNGITSISFDFPGHGESEQNISKLTIDVCISYINSVISYVKREFGPDVNISFYAISFGAYILLNKLINDKDDYSNIILRSPAINMKEILLKSLLKDSFSSYKQTGKARAGHNGEKEIPYSFLEDIEKNDLYKNYKEKRKMIIIQGTLDDTALIKDTYKFIMNKPEIQLIEIKGLNHHMEPKEIKSITKKMMEVLKLT